jgi:glucosamine kinase
VPALGCTFVGLGWDENPCETAHIAENIPCDRTEPVAYYIGIDGGGSKTICAVGDETSSLAPITGGPSNVTRVGETRARQALQAVIREGCAAAKIELGQVQRVCIGAAGAGREDVAGKLREIVAELVSGRIEVVGDMQIALEAAFGAGPGVVVIAGTGSIAYGRNALGRTARAGGWGFAISDEGSGHWIGRAVVSEVVRAIDESVSEKKDAQAGANDLLLFRKIEEAWKIVSLDELVRKANSGPDFAALFPGTVSAADAGDPLAQRILSEAGQELGRLAAIVIRRLFPEAKQLVTGVPLAMVGGVFRHSSRLRESFCEAVQKLDWNVAVNPEVIDPVMGALEMARKGAS